MDPTTQSPAPNWGPPCRRIPQQQDTTSQAKRAANWNYITPDKSAPECGSSKIKPKECSKCGGKDHFAMVCPTREQLLTLTCENQLTSEEGQGVFWLGWRWWRGIRRSAGRLQTTCMCHPNSKGCWLDIRGKNQVGMIGFPSGYSAHESNINGELWTSSLIMADEWPTKKMIIVVEWMPFLTR